MLRAVITAVLATCTTAATAATLSQTPHFTGASAAGLFELFVTGEGQQRITGLPAHFVDSEGAETDRAAAGDTLMAFCFQPDQCGLQARVLDVQDQDGQQSIVMSWWNFGWASASDPASYSLANRGAPDSVLVLTFRDTAAGAQIELVQVNVPDYQVVIPNPDGTQEIGPLSAIVNTHWNTLYWDGVRRVLAE